MIVSTILSDVANNFGDPAQGRATPARLLSAYNDAMEMATRRFKVLEQDATFQIDGGEDRYLYPDDCVQMKGLKYTDTPTDVRSYRPAFEYFEDEERARNRWQKEQGDSYFDYLARAQFFQLIPQPTITVAAGGLLVYWKLAARITDAATGVFELRANMRLHIIDLMDVLLRRRNDRDDQWTMRLAAWEAEVAKVYDRIEDPSDDRRSQIRSGMSPRLHGRMI